MPLGIQQCLPKAKEERGPPKVRAIRKGTVGPNLHGKAIGDKRPLAKNRTTANGIRVPEAKVRERGNTMPTLAKLSILSPYGAIFTNVTATPPTGASTTLTGQEAHPPQTTDYGVKLAIDPDTLPIPALLPLSVSPPREREKPNLRATQSHTETVTGRVRTSRLTITLTRPLRHCTMNLPPRQRKCGGMIKNWDPL